MNKTRIRNYALWMSIVAQAVLVAQLGATLFFNYTITDELRSEIVFFADAILILLSTLGIISNPTKPNSGGYNL